MLELPSAEKISTMSAIQMLTEEAIALLKKMIAIPSFSKEEMEVADLIEQFLQAKGIQTKRLLNNVYAVNKAFSAAKPSILLNSHHDTVRPAKGYTTDPFTPTLEGEKLVGLGSNDAGGPLVALIQTFVHLYHATDLPFNLVLAATAEEEISGPNGIELLLHNETFLNTLQGSNLVGALVGEPTKMEMAVAERGLLVLDAVAHGKSGHAAREEGINAIQIALKDIAALSAIQFDRISAYTGNTNATVTVIETENKAHNVVPSTCRFVVDLRVNELYSFEELIALLQEKMTSTIAARSFRMRSTIIPMDHPLVKAGKQLGLHHYGSPTTSDKALMDFPALKIGPGDSARSHTADEYIYIHEIEKGIAGYLQLLDTSKAFF